jgi:hypothetical protein
MASFALGVGWAAGPSIGLFSDVGCTSCNLDIPSGQTRAFYVSAVNVGSSPEACGSLYGVELRVTGLPPGWVTEAEPSPLSDVSLGDPLGCGANIAFAYEQTADCIPLYTVTLHAASAATDVTLTVVPHCHPSHPDLVCPLIVSGCPPFPRLCVPGGSLLINSSHECFLPVAGATWSQVKQLFH